MAAQIPVNAPRTLVSAARLETAHLGHAQMFALSAMWFALSVLWGSLLTLIIPIQVEDMLRRSGLTAAQVEEQKAGILGLVVAAGAIVALVIPPIVGSLSDRSTHRLGRRRPYVIGGVAVTLVGLLGMIAPNNLLIYSAAYLLMQAGSNAAVAAYQGVIPDLVPKAQRGHASGWLGMMSILGNIVGLLLGSVGLSRAHADDLLTFGQQAGVYSVIIAILIVFLAITYFGVRETPLAQSPAPQTFVQMIKALWISPREHPDFAWVWLTRFLVVMGFNTVQFFLLYFLQDVVGIGRDEISGYAALMYLGLLISAAVASIIGGRVSDRRGRKPLIYLAGALMTLTAIAFIGYIALHNLPLPGPFLAAFNTVFYCGIGFGIGYGIYQAVDWALGTDVLPNGDDNAAKDLGVWHIALVLPQSLATVLAGALLSATATAGMPPGTRYSLVFAMSIFYFIVGTILVRNVRGAR